MNPSRNANTQDRGTFDSSVKKPSPFTDAEVEALLGAGLHGAREPLDALLLALCESKLSPEQSQRVEQRIKSDKKFDAYVRRYVERWVYAPPKPGEFDEAVDEESMRAAKQFSTRIALKKAAIDVPMLTRDSRRYGRMSYSASLSPQSPRLEPGEFGRRLAAELGTRVGVELVDTAFRTVAHTGDAEPWIREVSRLHQTGAIDASVAYFLTRVFDASAVAYLTKTSPKFRELDAQIERIEKEQADQVGLWGEAGGPRKWQKLVAEWDKLRESLLEPLVTARNGDRSPEAIEEGKVRYREGRIQVYGC